MASVQRPIKIYARLKPIFGMNSQYDISTVDHETGDELLKMSGQKNHDENHVVNNKLENFTFRFSKVFDRKTTQDNIFDDVARPVIDSCLLGYNGTIFAYGQTGSGKTFTMTGSRNVYEDRGIIPRTLQYIFHKFKEESDGSKIRAVFVSYLEIYNEGGYDLLHSSSMPGQLEDLVKVTLMEDGNQQMHLRNLSVHPIDSVEEATQLLYLGDHNRTIAETPLNEVSTRSHCIFTIHMNIREANSSTVRRSKLHLVDLAGSERVSNSSISGQLLTEARHINLALHYLEQVIVALGDANRQHIPYRNSMMTSVLRDSLGGNCMTSMIATVSLEQRNFQESLSTCRFSQRVAMVTNAAIPNEELDPNLVIVQLKSEVKKLKETIGSSLVKPMKENASPLTPEENADCVTLVDLFLKDCDPNAILPVLPDMRMIQECFRLLRTRPGIGNKKQTKAQKLYSTNSKGKEMESGSLIQTIARRDAEIRVLMDMLRSEKVKRGNFNKSKDTINKNIQAIATATPMTMQQSTTKTITNYLADETGSCITSDIMSESAVLNYPSTQSSQMPLVKPLAQCKDEEILEELSEVKRKALTTFMEEYSGTKPLEDLRNDLTRKRADLGLLEETMLKNKSNKDSLRELLQNSSSPNDTIALSGALNSQERTYELEEGRLETKREEIAKAQKLLTTLYHNLMRDFETWWNQSNQVSIGMENQDQKSGTNMVNAIKRSQVETMSLAYPVVVEIGRSGKGQFKQPLLDSAMKSGDLTSQTNSTRKKNSPRTKSNTTRKDQKFAIKPAEIRPPPKAPPVTPVSPLGKWKSSLDEDELRKLPLTGDPETDSEIMSFFRARRQVFKKMSDSSFI